ncbi:MAG: DUF3619 family protein [Desulforhopalus sp.]|nr:DUF3619 family protein [Desulforhopalus sp.]
MTIEEKTFVDSAKRLLDESLADIDGATLASLARARKAALAGHKPQKSFIYRPFFWFGSAASLAGAILLIVLIMPKTIGQGRSELGLVADLSIITSEEPIDLFEDIEFYEWISALEGEAPATGGPGSVPGPFHDGTGTMPVPGPEGRGA